MRQRSESCQSKVQALDQLHEACDIGFVLLGSSPRFGLCVLASLDVLGGGDGYRHLRTVLAQVFLQLGDLGVLTRLLLPPLFLHLLHHLPMPIRELLELVLVPHRHVPDRVFPVPAHLLVFVARDRVFDRRSHGGDRVVLFGDHHR